MGQPFQSPPQVWLAQAARLRQPKSYGRAASYQSFCSDTIVIRHMDQGVFLPLLLRKAGCEDKQAAGQVGLVHLRRVVNSPSPISGHDHRMLPCDAADGRGNLPDMAVPYGRPG